MTPLVYALLILTAMAPLMTPSISYAGPTRVVHTAADACVFDTAQTGYLVITPFTRAPITGPVEHFTPPVMRNGQAIAGSFQQRVDGTVIQIAFVWTVGPP